MIWPLVAAVTAVAVSSCGGSAGNSNAASQNPAVSASGSGPAGSGSGPAAPGSGSAGSGSGPAAPGSGAAPPGSGSPPTQASSQLLDGLTPVAGGMDSGNVEVNGKFYADSIYLYPSPPGSVSYNLGRQWRRFQATVGLSDNSLENVKVRFQIFADGRSIYDHIFTLGQSQQINLDVSNVLRLDLTATLESADAGPTEAVWGNAMLTS